jgi:hypothetical protein
VPSESGFSQIIGLTRTVTWVVRRILGRDGRVTVFFCLEMPGPVAEIDPLGSRHRRGTPTIRSCSEGGFHTGEMRSPVITDDKGAAL